MREDRSRTPFFRRALAVLPLLGVLAVACSDDDEKPTDPGDPGGATSFDVPADGTLGQVVALASAGDTIRVTGTDSITATVTIDASLDELVIEGRRTPRGEARPVLHADVSGAAIVVAAGATGVVIRGLELDGAYQIGVQLGGGEGLVEDCWITGAALYAISSVGSGENVIARNVLENAGTFGVRCVGTSPEIRENTIVGAGDCGIYSQSAAPLIERNVIYGSVNYGIACFGTIQPTLSCNVMHMNGQSNTQGCAPGAGDVDADPLFCGDGSYAVEVDSPAADGEPCGWVGAVQATCAPDEGRSAAHAHR